MKFGILLAGIALLSAPLFAGPSAAGIAATVDGKVITTAELKEELEPWLASVASELKGAQLEAALENRKQRLLHALIDRALLIEALYREGGKIPDSAIDGSLDQIIHDQYGGDRAGFLSTLKERGITLEKYRQEIAENFIVGYMRHEHPDPAWFGELRKSADIKIY